MKGFKSELLQNWHKMKLEKLKLVFLTPVFSSITLLISFFNTNKVLTENSTQQTLCVRERRSNEQQDTSMRFTEKVQLSTTGFSYNSHGPFVKGPSPRNVQTAMLERQGRNFSWDLATSAWAGHFISASLSSPIKSSSA